MGACRRHARYRFTRTEIRHSRLGSSVQSMPELFDHEKTIVSIGSMPTGERDDWPLWLSAQAKPYRDRCPLHMLRCIRLSLPMSHSVGWDRGADRASNDAYVFGRFRGFTGSLPLQPARLLAPLYGSDWNAQPSGTFTSRLSTVRSPSLPVAGYNYNSDWTPVGGTSTRWNGS